MLRGSSIALSGIEWDVFGTLTWSGHVPSQVCAVARFEWWLEWVARAANVRYERLLWAVREEHGEVGGRLHLHPLIAFGRSDRDGLKYFEAPEGGRSVASRRWPFGMSRFRRVFSADDPAVLYMSKGLGSAGHTYELVKSERSSYVVVSDAVVKLLRRQQDVGTSALERRVGGLDTLAESNTLLKIAA